MKTPKKEPSAEAVPEADPGKNGTLLMEVMTTLSLLFVIAFCVYVACAPPHAAN